LYKENSKIEIYFNGIISSWLLDEEPVSSVEFTFSEVLKNIFQNYVTAWNAAPFSQYYINTVLMATTTTVFEIIIASMAAFAFAKLNFWGKNIIFTLFLATMMVPGEVLLVPNYITISRFQWLDSYYALIVPWIVSVFAIFLLRQQFMTVPNDLWDAAKIDGSSSWRFLWTVMVPLSKPALLTGALLKFVGSWNAFLWVLIVTKSPEMRTLAVGLQTFRSESGEIYNLLMAASTFSMIPIVIIFIFLQRYFVEGIAKSGLKG
jgi:multiple sugar transport system permease protein